MLVSPEIIAIIVYGGLLKVHSLGWLSWVWAGVVAALGPFIISKFIIGAIGENLETVLRMAFHLEPVVILLAQTALAIYTFHLLDTAGGSISRWFFIAITAGLVIYFAAPPLISGALGWL